MKITIDGFEIEGTPSKIKEFLSLNKPSTTFKTGNSDMDALYSPGSIISFVSYNENTGFASITRVFGRASSAH
jgi:hypothetical protein